MRETIKLVMDAEKKASEIVSEARNKASELITKHNSELSEKLNNFRAEELERYNQTVKKAESEFQVKIDEIRNSEDAIDADLNKITDEVLERVLKTVFDT